MPNTQVREHFEELSDQIDRDTSDWQKGHTAHPKYQEALSMGAEILPIAVGQLAEGRPYVWRVPLVHKIVELSLNRSVYFDKAKGQGDEIAAKQLLEWWKVEGQAAYDSLGD